MFQSRYRCYAGVTPPNANSIPPNTLTYINFIWNEFFSQLGFQSPLSTLYFKTGNARVGGFPPDTYYSLDPNQAPTKSFISSGQAIQMKDQNGKRYNIVVQFGFSQEPSTKNIVRDSLATLLRNQTIYLDPENTIQLFLV